MSNLEMQKHLDNPGTVPVLFRQLQRKENCSLVNSGTIMRRVEQITNSTRHLHEFIDKKIARYKHPAPDFQNQPLPLVSSAENTTWIDTSKNELQRSNNQSAHVVSSTIETSGLVMREQNISDHSHNSPSKLLQHHISGNEKIEAVKNVSRLPSSTSGTNTILRQQDYAWTADTHNTIKNPVIGDNAVPYRNSLTDTDQKNASTNILQSSNIEQRTIEEMLVSRSIQPGLINPTPHHQNPASAANTHTTVQNSAKGDNTVPHGNTVINTDQKNPSTIMSQGSSLEKRNAEVTLLSRAIRPGLINSTTLQRAVSYKTGMASRHSAPVTHLLLRSRSVEQTGLFPTATAVSGKSQTSPRENEQTTLPEPRLYRKPTLENIPGTITVFPEISQANDTAPSSVAIEPKSTSHLKSVEKISPPDLISSGNSLDHDPEMSPRIQPTKSLQLNNRKANTSTCLTAPVVSPVTGSTTISGGTAYSPSIIYRSIAQSHPENSSENSSKLDTVVNELSKPVERDNTVLQSGHANSDLHGSSEQIIQPESNHLERNSSFLIFRKENLSGQNFTTNFNTLSENIQSIPETLTLASGSSDSLTGSETSSTDSHLPEESHNVTFWKESTTDNAVPTAPVIESTHKGASVEMVWRKENTSNSQAQFPADTLSINPLRSNNHTSVPVVSRTVDETENNSSRAGSSQPSPDVTRGGSPQNVISIDIDAIVDQVERTLSRRMMIERERRGERL